MHNYTRSLRQLDRTGLSLAGGKGANLGELFRIPGLRVPPGFCVTTEAYATVIRKNGEIAHLLDEIQQFSAEELAKIAASAARIRALIEETVIPGEITNDILDCLAGFGDSGAFAIRSSATAEDLPTASFAGQQDSYLNISGKDAILGHIKKCWASLFTDRAVVYRIRNGFDHRKVQLAVVVQQMILPAVSGVMFTADPVTGSRKLLSIDAGFGLGEALVSGHVNPHHYTLHAGGIVRHPRAATQVGEPPLTDEQVLRLQQIGRTIEQHFGQPQDIEWCLSDDNFFVVQARPITTLFPVPENDVPGNHVYVSVGHQQMMTDPMKPLGLSTWQLMAFRPMHEAGGRLYIDVTASLVTAAGREAILRIMRQHDPLIEDALRTVIARGDFIPGQHDGNSGSPAAIPPGQTQPWAFQPKLNNDPAIVSDLIRRSEAAIAALRQEIGSHAGTDLFDFILRDIGQLKKSLVDSQSLAVITTAIEASRWLNEKMKAWLGVTGAADKVSQSVRDNITSEMGLELLDVADEIRPYADIVNYLRDCQAEASQTEDFLAQLPEGAGGQAARKAIGGFLAKYGMRCAGEIDITKPRWSEHPAPLIPILLGNIKNFHSSAAKRKFEKGLADAGNTERSLLDRLNRLPDGAAKAAETSKVISLFRDFIGYREYPKFQIVHHLWLYKQALLKEADRLLQAGVIRDPEDIYFLSFAEFREAVRTAAVDERLIATRKAAHGSFEGLTPPRVMTSDGEVIAGAYNREHLPPGALAGLSVSSGVVEGRARVIHDMKDADLRDGDILVTPFTDPSWTPLFVAIKGLVTEVGGLMTHGAVIAREYGLPAVVGVEQATRLIRDGQRIRVNGTDGYIEFI